jgi:hypothetical protein
MEKEIEERRFKSGGRESDSNGKEKRERVCQTDRAQVKEGAG